MNIRVVTVVFVTMFALNAHAQECTQLLTMGVFNEFNEVSKSAYTRRAQTALCREDISTYEQAKNTATSAGIGIKALSVRFGNSSSETNFAQWKSSFCSMSDDAIDASTGYEVMRREVSADLLKEFRRCTETAGLHIWAIAATDPRTLQIKIVYRPVSPDSPERAKKKAKIKFIDIMGAKCSNANVDEIEEVGDLILNCTRDPVTPVNIVVNSDKGSKSLALPGFFCPVCAPARPCPSPSCPNPTRQEWRAFTSSNFDRKNAVFVGKISDSPEPCFVCRASDGSNVHGGKLCFYGTWSCFIGNGGKEQRYNQFEALTLTN